MTDFGSVCSGIEAASVAWEPLGMRAAWLSEIEPFPSAVLAHHWPHVTNLGDMTNLATCIRAGMIPPPEVLVGGTPCQAFSVAGLRGGMADARGQLTLTYVDILNAIDEKRPTGDEAVCVWENVPGVLSSKDNAFGCFLAALCGEDEQLTPPHGRWAKSGCVFGPQRAVAWRILDAQYFGVAQRRRRVFVVASAREGFDPCAVLFESEGVRRDTPPSRETEKAVAALTANGVGTCGADDKQAQAGHLLSTHRMVAFGEYAEDGTASTMKARDYKDATDLVASGFQQRIGRNGRGDMGGLCSALNAQSGQTGKGGSAPCVAFHHNSQACQLPTESRDTTKSDPLTCSQQAAVQQGATVRRLTPIECERLQGFPDNHTRIPWRGKDAENCPDGPRYKACGNSKAVPVVRWVGKRLLAELNR